MSPTYCVLGIFDILLKPLGVVFLDQVHALTVQFLNRLPNGAILLVVVLKLEALSPVAEIGGYDEDGVGVVKVRS